MEAKEIAEKVLEQSAAHPMALCVLARLDLRDRKEKSAREKLERAFDPATPHPAVVAILGRMTFDDKDYKTSARVFAAGLERYPKELGFTFLLAVSLLKIEETQRLPELFGKVAERDFDDLTSRNWLLQHAIETENWEEAIRWGRESMQIDVRDAAVHRRLGLAYLKTANKERARRHLTTALELKGDDEEAKVLLEAAR